MIAVCCVISLWKLFCIFLVIHGPCICKRSFETWLLNFGLFLFTVALYGTGSAAKHGRPSFGHWPHGRGSEYRPWKIWWDIQHQHPWPGTWSKFWTVFITKYPDFALRQILVAYLKHHSSSCKRSRTMWGFKAEEALRKSLLILLNPLQIREIGP